MKGRVLIVDDDHAMCEMLYAALQHRGFEVTFRTSGEEAMEVVHGQLLDVVVADLNMPGMSGLALCERVVANYPEIPVIVLTAFGSMDTAVAAIRAGGYDFISKPVEIDVLTLTLRRAVQHRQLQTEVKRLREAATGREGDDALVGDSAPMQKLTGMLERVAASDTSVLIVGETGTGKELIARALHRQSPRRAGPFVAINCAAMPEALLESELFGHVKGAFTDARTAHEGLFIKASGGVLFLDEIGELPTAIQPKLLRALQEKSVRPVGGDREVTFDTRIISATNRDLESDVAERRFREDLLYRVNVIQLTAPPLRVRGNDILLLAQHFVGRFAAETDKPVTGFSPEVADRLLSYQWPGNVRELQNCMERAIALTRCAELIVDDLPEKIRDYRATDLPLTTFDGAQLLPLHEVERRYILHVLDVMGGNKSNAARALGLDRTTLYRKLDRFSRDPSA